MVWGQVVPVLGARVAGASERGVPIRAPVCRVGAFAQKKTAVGELDLFTPWRMPVNPTLANPEYSQ